MIITALQKTTSTRVLSESGAYTEKEKEKKKR